MNAKMDPIKSAPCVIFQEGFHNLMLGYTVEPLTGPAVSDSHISDVALKICLMMVVRNLKACDDILG